ncbi:hypothetical protein SHIRM173S_00688 [Streptomyces hirsutus]
MLCPNGSWNTVRALVPTRRRAACSPARTAALAALASLAHGWQLGIRSAYLPNSLLRTPQH